MEKIFVSACLIGQPVRYNGGDNRVNDAIFKKWEAEGRIVSLCPEVSGGLPVPRPPYEIVGFGGGAAVIKGQAKVMRKEGQDGSDIFLKGANEALGLALANRVKVAILKEGSPSCGSSLIYDGSFSKQKTPGSGVTAALLTSNGIKVFSEHQIPEANAFLQNLEKQHG